MSEVPPDEERCIETKADGKRCTRPKEEGRDYCWQHPRDNPGKSSAGRKSKYEDIDLEEVQEWAREGLTDYEIAKRLGIGVSTLYDYKNEFPEFSEALKKAKKQADFRIENSLYQRALGYDYEEVTKERVKVYDHEGNVVDHEIAPTKIVKKHVKPDPTSIIFWLKNRQPHNWKDKRNIEHEGGIEQKVNMDQLEKELSQLSEEELRKLAYSIVSEEEEDE